MKFNVLYIGIVLVLFIGWNNKKDLYKDETVINVNDSNFHYSSNKVKEDSNIKYSIIQLDNTNGLSNNSINTIF